MNFSASGFEPGFKWGVSTAAYQIEGAHNTAGKGPSIWDVFAHTKGKTHMGQHADVTCDFYHRYAQDIALMSILNIPNFRFSLSWSRLLPEGSGAVNYKGIDFYNKVIDFCLELGIEPWITLYHWDLPYGLEKRGGWTNREIIGWFSDYVQLCMKSFGSRVKHWMILNEPMVFTGAGYFLGIHAPGRRGLNNFLAATHHAAICQAEGARIIRAFDSKAHIGTTFSCSYIQPFTTTERDMQAAIKVDALLNRLFVEPLVGLGYPVPAFGLLQRLEQFIKDGDEQRLSFPVDFLGVQNYTREVVAYSPYVPLLQSRIVKPAQRNVESTLMNWEIYPECLYHVLHKFNGYGIKEIVVTENGAAFSDQVKDGQIHDTKRREYLEDHIYQVARAKKEGVNVTGYFVWSFTDNFEWAEGYRPRFGLVHVDFTTQKRTVKQSGKWFGAMISSLESNRLPLAVR